MTARKYSDQIVDESTNNFTIHMYLGKIVKTLPIFIEYLNSDPICLKTIPKIKDKDDGITSLSIRCHFDLKNPVNDLKVCSKKYFFSSE